jgi:hypothetical protein
MRFSEICLMFCVAAIGGTPALSEPAGRPPYDVGPTASPNYSPRTWFLRKTTRWGHVQPRWHGILFRQTGSIHEFPSSGPDMRDALPRRKVVQAGGRSVLRAVSGCNAAPVAGRQGYVFLVEQAGTGFQVSPVAHLDGRTTRTRLGRAEAVTGPRECSRAGLELRRFGDE